MRNVSQFVRHACVIAAVGVAMSVPATAGHEEEHQDPAVVEEEDSITWASSNGAR